VAAHVIDSGPLVTQASIDETDSNFSRFGMEVTRGKRSSSNLKPRTRSELIVQHWQHIGRLTIGARELRAIQRQLRNCFGEAAVESPAAIARVLADEGAELRHPEVLEFDAEWREKQILGGTQHFSESDFPEATQPLTLERAAQFIDRLEKLRGQFEQKKDQAAVQRMRTQGIEARQTAQLLARRKTLGKAQRAEQAEIAEWLGVWIKTPNLFADWLELRRRSPEFRKKFPGSG
jgi:hypothetical protein